LWLPNVVWAMNVKLNGLSRWLKVADSTPAPSTQPSARRSCCRTVLPDHADETAYHHGGLDPGAYLDLLGLVHDADPRVSAAATTSRLAMPSN
jgi:hypothetical protein